MVWALLPVRMRSCGERLQTSDTRRPVSYMGAMAATSRSAAPVQALLYERSASHAGARVARGQAPLGPLDVISLAVYIQPYG